MATTKKSLCNSWPFFTDAQLAQGHNHQAWRLVLYEPRVEPLIPARFGDFLEVRPGSRFDHKGANRFGKRNSSQKSKLPSKNQIKLSPNRIHFIFRMGNYGEQKFMDSTCPELIKLCTFSGGFFCRCNSIIQYLLMKVRFG